MTSFNNQFIGKRYHLFLLSECGMSFKDIFVKKLNDLFYNLGLDPLLGWLFLILITSIFTVKDMKNWKNISSYSKTMDNAVWVATFFIISLLILRTIRGV